MMMDDGERGEAGRRLRWGVQKRWVQDEGMDTGYRITLLDDIYITYGVLLIYLVCCCEEPE
jgi:hypothetical protein